MPNPRELDPTKSPISYFGYELRRYRKEAGLSQAQLAGRMGYSVGAISMAETARRPPTADFAKNCDDTLELEGALVRIKIMIDNVADQLPAWFRPWVEIEQTADSLRFWQPLIVPGLLQTADYARSIVSGRPGASAERVQKNVAARLDRQLILRRERPPMLWVVLDEGVLGRLVGDRSIMAAQLDHLLDVAGRPHITIQVLPFEACCTTGLLGGFVIAQTRGIADTVYMESASHGQVSDRTGEVTDITTRYEAIKAEALPRRASRELIAEVRDRWTRN